MLIEYTFTYIPPNISTLTLIVIRSDATSFS